MGMGGPRSIPTDLPLGKRPGTVCTGCWVGPTAGLDGCGKSPFPPGFGSHTVQAVASHYTILRGFISLFYDAVSTEAVGHRVVDDW
jgi:hypothetical protein